MPHGVDFLEYDDLRSLPRACDVFDKIQRDPILTYHLPKPGITAGKVLAHATSAFQYLLDYYQPMTFKFGITHDPHKRWYNKRFGYQHSQIHFARMRILYVADSPHGPAFLEAALIAEFGSYPTAKTNNTNHQNCKHKYILFCIVFACVALLCIDFVLIQNTFALSICCARVSVCVCGWWPGGGLLVWWFGGVGLWFGCAGGLWFLAVVVRAGAS